MFLNFFLREKSFCKVRQLCLVSDSIQREEMYIPKHIRLKDT
jgi:hypothetical protein